MKHEKLILDVIKMFASNHPEILEQYNIANKVVSSDDYGFYVNFTFEKEPKNLIDDTKPLKDVGGKDQKGESIIVFILFIEEGIIKMLEGSSYDEWPDSDDEITVCFDEIKRF